jgi:hypothetical protein
MYKSNQDSESLQLQAIERARQSFARLPKNHALFVQCLEGNETISDVLTAISRRHHSYSRKKSSRALQSFEQYTTWLRSISDAVDIVVQTQAGIGCPLWAPIKFVLKVCYLFIPMYPFFSSFHHISRGCSDLFAFDCSSLLLKYTDCYNRFLPTITRLLHKYSESSLS